MKKFPDWLRWIVWGFGKALYYLPKRGACLAVRFVVAGFREGITTFVWRNK